MAIARFPSIVIDCPDPDALAAFYGALLNWAQGSCGATSTQSRVRWTALRQPA
jgi:Glyoxalase-like domain